MSELEQYINDLENILSKHFHVKRHSVVLDRSFLLSARHTHTMGRTLITSKDVIDKYEVQKIVLVLNADNINRVLESAQWVKENIYKIVKPHSEHYLTLINLTVIFNNPVPDNVRQFIGRYALTKYFRFFLHGWAQVGITAVSLKTQEVVCSKKVTEMKRLFYPEIAS